jgi:hypothetical protein
LIFVFQFRAIMSPITCIFACFSWISARRMHFSSLLYNSCHTFSHQSSEIGLCQKIHKSAPAIMYYG